MTLPHRVRFGVAKTLYHVPRDRYARAAIASSPTFAVVALWHSEDSTEREIVAETVTTVDTTTTTLSDDAGPAEANPKLLPVASSVGFVAGRSYLLVQGEVSQLVTCEGIDTGQFLCKQEVRHPFTSGATLRGVEISASFPADAADEDDLEAGGGPYGIVWSYTIAGVGYYPIEEAWVVRYDAQPLITTADLERRWPEVASMVSTRWSLEDAIASASDDFLADIESSGRDPHGLLHSAVARVCVADKALEKLHRWSRSDRGDEYAEVLRMDYDRRVRDLLTGQTPVRTAEISHTTNTATQGGSRVHGQPIIRRS